MNEQIRRLFPAANKYTYLNSAAVSPMPLTAVAAANWQLTDVAENGTKHFDDWVAKKNEARGLLAEMLNVRPEQVAFMRNTSDGFASVANGITWRDTDNIVSFENEFPANFYPWRMVRDRFGVQLRLCPERDGRIEIDELIGMIDVHTQLVAISAVQFASGFRADLERIGKAARDADALFAVDIIQALGAMAIDLPSQYVDIAAGSSHKWLCSPEGGGMIYLSERARERVQPTDVGWISVEDPWDFEDTEQDFKRNALAWETGTGPSAVYFGMAESLKLFKETGLKNIANYLDDLSTYLCDSLAGKPYKLISSRRPGERSAIVCIEHTGGRSSADIADELEAKDVIVSPRGSRLRISPHFYNTTEDIDEFIRQLPD